MGRQRDRQGHDDSKTSTRKIISEHAFLIQKRLVSRRFGGPDSYQLPAILPIRAITTFDTHNLTQTAFRKKLYMLVGIYTQEFISNSPYFDSCASA